MGLLFIVPEFMRNFTIAIATRTNPELYHPMAHRIGNADNVLTEYLSRNAEENPGVVLVSHDQRKVFSAEGIKDEYHNRYLLFIDIAHSTYNLKVAAVLNDDSKLPKSNQGLDLIVSSMENNVRVDLNVIAEKLRNFFYTLE